MVSQITAYTKTPGEERKGKEEERGRSENIEQRNKFFGKKIEVSNEIKINLADFG